MSKSVDNKKEFYAYVFAGIVLGSVMTFATWKLMKARYALRHPTSVEENKTEGQAHPVGNTNPNSMQKVGKSIDVHLEIVNRNSEEITVKASFTLLKSTSSDLYYQWIEQPGLDLVSNEQPEDSFANVQIGQTIEREFVFAIQDPDLNHNIIFQSYIIENGAHVGYTGILPTKSEENQEQSTEVSPQSVDGIHL